MHKRYLHKRQGSLNPVFMMPTAYQYMPHSTPTQQAEMIERHKMGDEDPKPKRQRLERNTMLGEDEDSLVEDDVYRGMLDAIGFKFLDLYPLYLGYNNYLRAGNTNAMNETILRMYPIRLELNRILDSQILKNYNVESLSRQVKARLSGYTFSNLNDESRAGEDPRLKFLTFQAYLEDHKKNRAEPRSGADYDSDDYEEIQ